MPANTILKRYRNCLVVGPLLAFGTGFVPIHSLAQQPNSSNPAAQASSQPNGQFVGTFTNPYTGKQYDRYLEQKSVPVPRWEYQEVTERRMVPHWVTENLKTTEVRYVPYVEYLPQQRVTNRWNPLAQPQVVMEYVPITRYQAVNQVVERPTPYQKYVEEDVKVRVPKLVQTTEARMEYVDRERTPNSGQTANAPNAIQNAADLAMANRNSQVPRYPTRPMEGWYSGSQSPSAVYPFSPYASVAMATNVPAYGNSYATSPNWLPGGSSPVIPLSPFPSPQTQLVSNQTIVPPISNPYPSAYPSLLPTNAYAVTRPPFQWPSWSSSNGPLFRQDLFRQNQSMAYGVASNGGAYAYPTVASQSNVTGAMRPSTAPLLPQGQSNTWGNFGGTQTYRDPIQAGLPPTVLR